MVKTTSQREAIKRVLQGNKSHPSAKEIFDMVSSQLPYITKPTVYNILHSMVENDELQVLTVDKESLRFDPETKPHAHLFCTSCRRVYDLDIRIPGSLIQQILKRFSVSNIELNVRGICPSCNKKEKEEFK